MIGRILSKFISSIYGDLDGVNWQLTNGQKKKKKLTNTRPP